MYDSDGRRRRPAVSCALCRKRKIRCDRERPCSNCVRSKSEVCVYENPTHHLPSSPRRHAAGGSGSGPAPQSRDSMPAAVDAFDGGQSTASERSTLANYPPSSQATSSSTSTTATSHSSSSSGDAESIMLRRRVQQLEEQLSKSSLGSAPSHSQSDSPVSSNIETTSSRLGGTYHIHCQNDLSGQHPSIARNVTHKTRLIGQSHWGVNGVLLLRDIFEPIEARMLEREEPSTAWSNLERCKHLARVIKARRAPKWPAPPTPDLPPREVADALVECYLGTTESIYRILHVPSFRRDYEALWAGGDCGDGGDDDSSGRGRGRGRGRSTPDTAFLVQLKLVLAIGATTYDETFSLRVSAVHWVYEALTWVAEPAFKSRLNLPSLQTDLLLLVAQERVDVSADAAWISVGALLRRAVHMGLHRDPARLAPPRTGTGTADNNILVIEMRRRLWNTILELALHSSLVLGVPLFVSLTDFDTAPPGNFDDEQLDAGDAAPRPAARFTQTSVAIALRRSFPCRLAVVKFLNDLASSGTYEETLRLDGELRAAYRDLRRALQACSSSSSSSSSISSISSSISSISSSNNRISSSSSTSDGDGGRGGSSGGGSNWGARHSPSAFEIQVVEFLMHRYISALHIPYFSPALREAAYAYSRKVVVESSLKIWRIVCPSSYSSSYSSSSSSSSSSMSAPSFSSLTTAAHSSHSSSRDGGTAASSSSPDPHRVDLARLATCSAGFYPTIATHAALLITVELRTQLQEEESLGLSLGLGPVALRPDLLCVLEEAKSWCMRGLRAGETSVKRYLLMNLVAVEFDRLARGLGLDAGAELMLRTAEKVVAACVPLLEEMVAELGEGGGGGADGGGLQRGEIDLSGAMMMEDWDFMSSDVLLNPGTEPAGWLFDDGVNNGVPALW